MSTLVIRCIKNGSATTPGKGFLYLLTKRFSKAVFKTDGLVYWNETTQEEVMIAAIIDENGNDTLDILAGADGEL